MKNWPPHREIPSVVLPLAMVISTATYPGEAYWFKGSSLTDTQVHEAITDIRRRYEAGVPFYTKETIRKLAQQLECARERQHSDGDMISVKALDGTAVDFKIESGRILTLDKMGVERILTSPFIHYLSVQELTSAKFNYVPRIAQCNMRVYHRIVRQHQYTKQIFDSPLIKEPEEVAKLFRDIQSTWMDSKPCAQLRSIFQSTSLPQKIDNMIGFAFGPFAYGLEEPGTVRAAYQHALILTLQDVITRNVDTEHIACFVQDPEYTEVDKTILSSHGIASLEDPRGFLRIDDKSVVISCAPSVPVKQIVSELARPAIIIWDRVSDNDAIESSLSLDPDSSRVRAIIQRYYDSLQFPDALEHFGDLVIYVRREHNYVDVKSE